MWMSSLRIPKSKCIRDEVSSRVALHSRTKAGRVEDEDAEHRDARILSENQGVEGDGTEALQHTVYIFMGEQRDGSVSLCPNSWSGMNVGAEVGESSCTLYRIYPSSSIYSRALISNLEYCMQKDG